MAPSNFPHDALPAELRSKIQRHLPSSTRFLLRRVAKSFSTYRQILDSHCERLQLVLYGEIQEIRAVDHSLTLRRKGEELTLNVEGEWKAFFEGHPENRLQLDTTRSLEFFKSFLARFDPRLIGVHQNCNFRFIDALSRLSLELPQRPLGFSAWFHACTDAIPALGEWIDSMRSRYPPGLGCRLIIGIMDLLPQPHGHCEPGEFCQQLCAKINNEPCVQLNFCYLIRSSDRSIWDRTVAQFAMLIEAVLKNPQTDPTAKRIVALEFARTTDEDFDQISLDVSECWRMGRAAVKLLEPQMTGDYTIYWMKAKVGFKTRIPPDTVVFVGRLVIAKNFNGNASVIRRELHHRQLEARACEMMLLNGEPVRENNTLYARAQRYFFDRDVVGSMLCDTFYESLCVLLPGQPCRWFE
ncbi:unnamed protein product, partial [Mesorhabditis spiculigera]